MQENPPVNLRELQERARQVLPKAHFDYIASGADDQLSLRRNEAAFERLTLLPRMLVDVSQLQLEVEVLGQALSLPVILAPTALHALAHPQAEEATARAAAAAGTLFTLSTLASRSLEEVAAAADGPRWFQLYCTRDRGMTRAMVQRAEAAGYSAVVLTVDAPVLGRREPDERNRFQLPPEVAPRNLLEIFDQQAIDLRMLDASQRASALAAVVDELFDPTITWQDLDWLCDLTSLPVLVKGILAPQDARLAAEHGAAGVVVSNHGGRQLDGVPAPIEALPGIAEAVADRLTILMDGGVRRGTDVLKALILGARAVLIGRPYLWGLAIGGEDGVRSVIEMLRQEISVALALLGCPRITELGAEHLWTEPADPGQR